MTLEAWIDPGRLAWLPLVFLAEQEQRFDIDLAAGEGLAEYHEVMTSGLRVYQLYHYQEMVRRRFGERVGREVHRLQCGILDSEQAGTGKALDAALLLIEQGLGVAGVGAETRGSIAFTLPAEQCVALALLTGLPESPDYALGEPHPSRQPEPQSGVEQRLAGLLAQGQRDLVQALSPVLSSMRFS